MSRKVLIQDVYAMLADMTTANGYSRTYTSVKSVDNDSATMKDTPWIGLRVGVEEPIFEGVGINQYRAMLPITFVARARAPHANRSLIEYDYSIERSEVIADIKKRFGLAYKEITPCTDVESIGEEDPRGDSNKNCFFTEYTIGFTYKEQR